MKNYEKIKILVLSVVLILTSVVLGSPNRCVAQSAEKTLLDSSPQNLARGLGHFERARSLLLAAVREFDTGYNFVKTDQVLDANQWRKTILSRAEELEVILSPKPRELKAGSNYQPNSGLLGARVKPNANIKTNPAVKPQIIKQPEAKIVAVPTKSKEETDLDISGS